MIEKIKKLIIETKDHLYSQLANVIFMVASIVQHIALNKYILTSKNDYGIYSTVLSVMGTTALLFTTGFPLFLTRKVARKEATKSDFLAIVLLDVALSTLAGISIYLFRGPLGSLLFKNYPVDEYLKIFVILLVSYTFSGVIQSFYQGKKLFKAQAILSSVTTIAKAISAIVLGYYFGITGALISYALPGYMVLIYFVFVYRKEVAEGFAHVYKSTASIFTNKSLWLFVIVTTLFAVIDNFLITRELLLVENFLPKILSDYSFVVMIGRLPIYPLATLALVFFPNYSRKEITHRELQKRLIRDTAFEIGISIPVLAGYLVFGDFIIRLISRVSMPNVSFVLFLVGCSSVSFAIFTLLCTKIQGFGKQNEALIAVIIAALVQLVTGPLLIQSFGAYGAALSVFVATFPVGSLLFFYVLYLLGKEDSEKTEAKTI